MDGVAPRLWSVCESLGLAPLVRRGYLTARVGPNGWRRRATIADTEAVFRTTGWLEYQRVNSFFGEGHVLESFLEALDGDEVVWDVGANVGLYACFAAKRPGKGRVVGFEPVPVNCQRLAANLRANAPSERWQVSQFALSNRDGTGWLGSTHDETLLEVPGAGHHFLVETPAAGWLQVPCRRGETLVTEGYPVPDVLKVDVQGAELLVLEGMGTALSGVDTVYVEVHPAQCPRYGTTAEEVERFLREAGYRLTNLGGADLDGKDVYYVLGQRAGD